MYFYLYERETPFDCYKLYNTFSLIDAVKIPIEAVNESLINNEPGQNWMKESICTKKKKTFLSKNPTVGWRVLWVEYQNTNCSMKQSQDS